MKPLYREMQQAVRNLRNGSLSYRKQLQSNLMRLPQDLSEAGMTVSSLHHFTEERWRTLVKYWKGVPRLSTPRIQQKLSAIRKAIILLNVTTNLPSNKALGLVHPPKLKYKIKEPKMLSVDRIQDATVKWLCGLQQQFGLKKWEAIRLKRYMLNESYLLIPRSIAYNQRDRLIPIVSQQEWIESHEQFLKISESHWINERVLSLLHSDALKHHGIMDSDHFRYQYINSRYRHLKEQLNEMQALRRLRQELGYRENRQIKQVITCLSES